MHLVVYVFSPNLATCACARVPTCNQPVTCTVLFADAANDRILHPANSRAPLTYSRPRPFIDFHAAGPPCDP